jgi:hypothetical protein
MVDSDVERDEKEALQAKAWDLWLNCLSVRAVAECIGGTRPTVGAWVEEMRKLTGFFHPPGCENSNPKDPKYRGRVQPFDIWQFAYGGNGSYFGRMPPQIIENLLWLFTEPGDIVFDPFAGTGTIDVAKTMGRWVWASDIKPSTPNFRLR